MSEIKDKFLAEAHAMYDEDIAACKTMGAHSAERCCREKAAC